MQGFYRTATVDYPIEDRVVPRGSRVMLLFGAANRDPRQFEEPNAFRLDRGAVDHLSFGGGVHFCLGAHLSRMEARQIISHLTKRVATVGIHRPTAAPPQRHDARADASSDSPGGRLIRHRFGHRRPHICRDSRR